MSHEAPLSHRKHESKRKEKEKPASSKSAGACEGKETSKKKKTPQNPFREKTNSGLRGGISERSLSLQRGREGESVVSQQGRGGQLYRLIP